MKIIGLLCLIVTGTLVGMMKSAEFGGRVKQLEAVLSMIQDIATQIRYRALPLTDLIRQISVQKDLECLPFLKQCAKNCEEGMAFPDAWEQSVGKQGKKSYLKEKDLSILYAFGSGLGTTDVEGQLANCHLHGKLVEESLKQARADRDGMGRLYSTLGILAGIGAAIVFA